MKRTLKTSRDAAAKRKAPATESPALATGAASIAALEKKIGNRINPSQIRNKVKRAQVYSSLKADKKKLKVEKRKQRVKEVEELGEDAPAKQIPRTLENTREVDATMVSGEDDEIKGDEATDEFADYFNDLKRPKLMITTRPHPSGNLFAFINELMNLIPNSFYYKRGHFDLKQICQFANNKKFTHLLVLSEKNKQCNGVVVSHLPHGPTAFFKISSITYSNKIPNAGKSTSHQPEIILNNFSTRLGHRVGRFFGSLFSHDPNFVGRQVVTFHNQRDFVFVRFHRYIFDDNGNKVRMQEIGPRFTLKMRWLQDGMFDTKFGEFEWMHKPHEMDTSRRRFFL